MIRKSIPYFLLIALCLLSCTTVRRMADNQKESGHYRLYTYPTYPVKEDYDTKRFKKIAIVASNDFDGNIFPTLYPVKNRLKEKRIIKIGGASAMRAYLDIFQKQYSKNLLFLDAGSFLHKTDNHRHTMFLYKYLNIDIAALGLNEFQIKRKGFSSHKRYIQSLTKSNRFDIVNSNLFDLKTAKQMKWCGISADKIKVVNGIKFGFIGITTPKSSKLIPDENINGIYIQNPSKSIIVKAKVLKRKGAQVVVLLANQGFDCTSLLSHQEGLHPGKVNFHPNISKHCNTHDSELYKILQQIPPGTVDLVFTSGGKSKVANYILGYPVLQNTGNGKFFSWVDVYFDHKHNLIDPKKTIIHQPINLCHNFLKSAQDCFIGETFENEEVSPAFFLGNEISIKPLPRFK